MESIPDDNILNMECLPDGDILNMECLNKGSGDGCGECPAIGVYT